MECLINQIPQITMPLPILTSEAALLFLLSVQINGHYQASGAIRRTITAFCA